MKRVTIISVVGFVFAAVGLAASNDAGASERFRMKYGRATPAEEAVLKANVAHRALPPVSAVAARNDAGAEDRFFMKLGRHTRFEDARVAARSNAASRASATPAPAIVPTG